VWLLVLLNVLLCRGGAPTVAAAALPLQSFYIALHVFSDDLASGYEELLDVAASGKDVRVRLMRMSLANQYCPAPLVRAVERVLPKTSVKALAGTDICSNDPLGVERALDAAKPKTISSVFEAASQTVVARCGSQERIFDFPWAQTVDRSKLTRSAPAVSALWDTYLRVSQRAFGKAFAMSLEPPARQQQFEALGNTLAGDLTSGKYQAAYSDWPCHDLLDQDCRGNYLAWRLRGYAGAPLLREPLPPELLEASAMRFVKYTTPVFSPIALSARVFGDVRLRMSADPLTGAATNVEVMSGPSLLSAAALAAAKSWQFEPGFGASAPIDVTLRFQIRCP
jgi:Gram-negative bacterial TonB protein C-terminal